VRKSSVAAVLAEVDIRVVTQKSPRATTTMTGSKLLQEQGAAEIDDWAVRKISVAVVLAEVDIRAMTL
jgi:hypothetical protein